MATPIRQILRHVLSYLENINVIHDIDALRIYGEISKQHGVSIGQVSSIKSSLENINIEF